MKRKEMWNKIRALQKDLNVAEMIGYRVLETSARDLRAEKDWLRRCYEEEVASIPGLRAEIDKLTEMSYAAQAELSWLRQRVGEGLYEEFVAEQTKGTD